LRIAEKPRLGYSEPGDEIVVEYDNVPDQIEDFA
jgi:hypothetical protein